MSSRALFLKCVIGLLIALQSYVLNAQNLLYQSGFSNTQSVSSDEGTLLAQGDILAFGPHLFSPYFNPNFDAPEFTLDGDQSEITGLYRGGAGETYVRTKTEDEFGFFTARENLIAYSQNGTLLWQIANRFATEIAPTADGFAQITSFDGACIVTRYDSMSRHVWSGPRGNNCVLNASPNSTSIMLLYPRSSEPLNFVELSSNGDTIRSGALALDVGEQYCGSKHIGSAVIVATCKGDATRIAKISITLGQSEWRRALARNGVERKIELQLLGDTILVHSERTTASNLNLADGAVRWNQDFEKPVVRVRSDGNAIFLVTSNCLAAPCNSITLNHLNNSGTVLASQSIDADPANVQIAPCLFDRLCLFSTVASNFSRTVFARPLAPGGDTLIEPEIELTMGAAINGSTTLFATEGAHTYKATVEEKTHIRVDKIRSDTGALLWTKSFGLNIPDGPSTSARLRALSVSNAMVGLGFDVQYFSLIGPFRRAVVFERLFASTGARLKPTEFTSSSAQQSAMLAVSGTDLWTGFEQGNFNTFSPCDLFVQKIALDSAMSAPVRLDCLLGRQPFIGLLGADVLVTTPDRVSRVSEAGLIYTLEIPDPTIPLIIAPDASRFLHIGGVNGSEVKIYSVSPAALIWSRVLSAATDTTLRIREAKILPTNDVLINFRQSLNSRPSNEGSAALFRLAANDGQTTWQVSEPISQGIRQSINSMLPVVGSNDLWSLRRTSRMQLATLSRSTFLDGLYYLERRNLSTGALLSQQQFGYNDEEHASLAGQIPFSLAQQVAPNRMQVFGWFQTRKGHAGNLAVAVIDTTLQTDADVELSGTVLATPGTPIYRAEFRVRNLSSNPVVGAELNLSSSGNTVWSIVQCLPAASCVDANLQTHRGKRFTLPVSGEVLVSVDVIQQEPSPNEKFNARVVLPTQYNESNLHDNAVELLISANAFANGFE